MHSNSTEINPFDFHGQMVRVVTGSDGEPLWVASDVATILGYREAKDMTRMLGSDEASRHKVPIMQVNGESAVKSMTVVTESGLYTAIFHSQRSEAKEFRRWVTHDVLPTIRKHGAFLTEEKIEAVLTDPDTIIRLATELKAERTRTLELEAARALDAPKIIFADAVSASNTSVLIGELAKILRGNHIDIGQNRLFEVLRARGFLISRPGSDWNMPTQKAMDLGLFKIKETAITHSNGHVSISKTTKVTGKGQTYFIQRFLDGRFAETKVPA